MIEALHLGSMLPAALGACCVAGGADRRSPLAWLGMLAMLGAMADTMLGPVAPQPKATITDANWVMACMTARCPHCSAPTVAIRMGSEKTPTSVEATIERENRALRRSSSWRNRRLMGVAGSPGWHAAAPR